MANFGGVSTPSSQGGYLHLADRGGVELDLHRSGNQLSLDLHKSGNKLSLDLHKSGNEFNLDLHKSSNEFNLDLHRSSNEFIWICTRSGNEFRLGNNINKSPKWNSSLLDFIVYYCLFVLKVASKCCVTKTGDGSILKIENRFLKSSFSCASCLVIYYLFVVVVVL